MLIHEVLQRKLDWSFEGKIDKDGSIKYINICCEIFISVMEVEKYVAYNTGPLVLSSTFFLVPCIYTIYNSMHFFTVLLILTSGISANYWRKAIYGWRRTLDLWFSKISFTIFVTNQLMYIWIIPPNHIGFSRENIRYYSSIVCFGNMVYFYYLSEKSYHKKLEQWSSSGDFAERSSVSSLEDLGFATPLRGFSKPSEGQRPSTTIFKGCNASSEDWRTYHFIFHIFVALEQLIILEAIPQTISGTLHP